MATDNDVNIIISDNDLDEIMQEFGFPLLDYTDLPFSRNASESEVKDYIKKQFIWKAMREYFRWFPVVEEQEVSIDTNFEIAFPDANTFNVLDAMLNTNTPTSGTPVGEPFVDSSSVFSTNYNYGKRYGTPYSYGTERTYHTRRAESQAVKNSQSAFRFRVDLSNRKVVGYSNVIGRMTITWAKRSEEFNSIRLDHYADVMDLCRAYIYRGWGSMLSFQSNTSLENSIDPAYMLDRSRELEDQVLERWQEVTQSVIIRNR